jgi:membrane protease YdiL (CAAX protease family)
MRKDPLRLAIQIGVYIVLYLATAYIFGPLMVWLGGYLTGITATGLMAAVFANWLTMRIYAARNLPEIGLWWRRASSQNLAIGLGGGVAAACLVLVPALMLGAARMARVPDEAPSFGAGVFVILLLAAGATGEEMLFRGYGFQVLLAAAGPWATIAPVGVFFALMHGNNPNASWWGLANTAGFGMLFGYAYLRSRDLWLPIGLHLGWNVTLPLFGVNLSGLKMKLTGYELTWTAGPLWSGGDYGPEASLLTSLVMILLFVFVWKAPIRRQPSPLTDPPRESAPCEPSPTSPS